MFFEIVVLVLFLFAFKMTELRNKRKLEECQLEKPPAKVFAKINHNKSEVSSNWQSFLRTAPVEKKQRFTSKPRKNLWRKMQTPQPENSSGLKPASNFGPVVKPVRLTKQIAMDCEMVGDEDDGDMLARVSIVNNLGECIYDKYVKPTLPVANYRTWVSGIRPQDLQNGESLETVQKEVADIIKGRILVGHAIRNDLKVLFLSHPHRLIRDTQRYKPIKTLMNSKRPSLKKLASHVLGIEIQGGEHSSVEDAKATMQLYQLYQKQWEKDMYVKMRPAGTIL